MNTPKNFQRKIKHHRLKTIALMVSLAAQADMLHAQSVEEVEENEEDVASLSDISVTDDPRRSLPTEPSASSFGFSKPLLETPRSVSTISSETIELFGLSAVEDLVQVVPGVFTTTRFGIQGSIDVRNVSADTYFRGMKRLNLQGHARSVLAAMDTIEVVKGPPSPIFGMGKIGGYTNMVPKSGRATTGTYLLEPQGFTQAIAGSYGKSEMSFGVGGPASIGEKKGGFYAYGLLEDAGTYIRDVDIGQKILQVALSVDDFAGPFRLESGINAQRSTTQGALTHRLTQGLIDNGDYVRGTPLVNLDIDGDGKIGYYEMHEGSPVRGNLGGANQPLIQNWAWPKDSDGNYLPIDEFPTIAGIPQSMYDYLVANPEADPTGLMRAQGVGGPLPTSGYVPVGFVMDPRTVGYDKLDERRGGAFERELQADLVLGFFDLVYDTDPNFTMKNQLFYDSMDQYKISEQPGGGKQDVEIYENKFTITKRLMNLPQWLQMNTLGSINYRHTEATGYRYGGDFATHRMDLMAQTAPMTPNTTFAVPFDNPDINNGGAPWTSDYKSTYSETGLGVMFDIDLFDKTNVMLGGRYDHSDADNIDYPGTFNATTGTSANPGRFRTSATTASGSDSGTSWSFSISHELPYNLRPYATIAESSLALESSNNSMPNAIINAGHIGSADLKEFGLKGSIFDNRAFFSIAHYEQSRTNVSEDEDDALLGADVSSTITEGIEAELKFVPFTNMFVSVYGLKQETTFTPNGGDTILVDARTLGFRDVVDADGNVIFPAEAFLYGGRSRILLPENMPGYNIKQGNPETQYGINANYKLDNGVGFTLSGNHFSSVYSGRLKLVKLPATKTLNAGIFWESGPWHLRLDVRNLTDERYFRARTGDTLGDAMAQAMPGRTWQGTVKINF